MGESFGGNVAAIQAEKFAVAPDGTRNLDAAFVSSGLVAGTRLQGYLLSDQRTVYQYYCQNVPRPGEPQYGLFLGVDDPKVTTAAVIRNRVNDCTGVLMPPDQRTAAQQQALSNIMRVLTISSETDFNARMSGGPLNLWDLTSQRLGGLNAFQSLDVVFRGSADDAALNAGIARYQANEAALRTLINDGEPTGQVSMPVMTMHTEDDERAWPEMESVYKDTFRTAGTSDWLLQVYVKQGGHVGFTVPEFRSAFNKLQAWIDTGTKPTRSDVTASCIGTSTDCRFDSTYEPKPWTSRQPVRSPAQPPVDAAMYQTALSPGTLFSIFGPNSVSAEQKVGSGPLPTTLGGITVTINGIPAPLLYVGPTQINGQVPYETPTGSAISRVITNGVSGALVPFRVSPAAPRIFIGQGNICIAQNEDGTLNSASNPVKTGHNIVAYLIGLGAVDPVVVTGAPAPTAPLSSPAGKVIASLGGLSLNPTHVGLTPSSVGLAQVSLLVPSDLTGGLQNFAVTVGNAASNTCLIAVGK